MIIGCQFHLIEYLCCLLPSGNRPQLAISYGKIAPLQMMSVFTYKMCWLFHGYLRVSYMIKLTDYISPCFMLKSPITGGYLAKKQHTCTEQSYPNVQWRIPNNSSWIPSGTKKKRGKNVRKSQDSNVDVPNETSMACAVRGPIPSPAVSW